MNGMTITGAKELEKKLDALERKVGRSISRKAARAGAKVVQAEAKSNARTMVGGNFGRLLARKIVVRTPRRQRRGSYSLDVQTQPIEKFPEAEHVTREGKRYYIPAVIEYGHGNARAIPYMRRAWDTTREKALAAIVKALRTGIEQATRRK